MRQTKKNYWKRKTKDNSDNCNKKPNVVVVCVVYKYFKNREKKETSWYMYKLFIHGLPVVKVSNYQPTTTIVNSKVYLVR